MWGSGGIAPTFLTSTLDGGEWQASRPNRFIPGEIAPGTQKIGGWVGPRACLATVEKRKTCPCLNSSPGRPASSPSLLIFFNSNSGGWSPNWVHSALRPLIGLLCQPRVIMMMEKLVELWLAEETKVLGENLPQCQFVHHKPHMFCPDAKKGRRGGKPANNRLSYGTALARRYADWVIPTPRL
jgi:hypothetical protein